MLDKQGREYAKLSELKEGDEVELDDGFTCIKAGKVVLGYEKEGGLFFRCEEGTHWLDGQLAYDDDSLVGVYPVVSARSEVQGA